MRTHDLRLAKKRTPQLVSGGSVEAGSRLPSGPVVYLGPCSPRTTAWRCHKKICDLCLKAAATRFLPGYRLMTAGYRAASAVQSRDWIVGRSGCGAPWGDCGCNVVLYRGEKATGTASSWSSVESGSAPGLIVSSGQMDKIIAEVPWQEVKS